MQDPQIVHPARQLHQERATRTVAGMFAQQAVTRVPLIEAHAAPPVTHRVPLLHAVETRAHELASW